MRRIAHVSILIVSLLIPALTGNPAVAQAKKPGDVAIGDRITFQVGREKCEGEVLEITAAGWYRVKFKLNGFERNHVVPPSRVEAVSKPGAAPRATTATKPEPAAPPPAAPAAAATATPAAHPAGPALRTWSDNTGKFKIEARFAELKGDQVTLVRSDGSKVTVGLNRLSDADQKLAREAAKAADEGDPFVPQPAGAVPPSAAPPAGPAAATAGSSTPARADLSSARQIKLAEPVRWTVKIDAAPAVSGPFTTKPIVLSGGQTPVRGQPAGQISVFESLDSLLFVPGRPAAYAVIIDKPPAKPPVIHLHHCDLATGKTGKPIPFPAAIRPVDIDPSGGWLLARPDVFLGNKGMQGPNEVTVCKLGEKDIQHQTTWQLDEGGRQAPTLAQFVGSDHVLTVYFPGQMVVWKTAQPKAVYNMELVGGCLPALSPGHKYLAAPAVGFIYLLDALSGAPAGSLPWDGEAGTRLSFRPNGEQLAALSPQRLQIFDVATGEQVNDMQFAKPHGASTLDWVGDNHLLLDGKLLVDLKLRSVVWHFYHASSHQQAYGEWGGVFWHGLTSNDRKQRGLFSAKLPTPDVTSALARLRAEDLLAVRPGASISLQLNLSGDDAEQQQARDALQRQLAQLGMVVADGSPLVLEASVEAGETREVQYRGFGGGGSEKASITEQISRLRLKENDQLLWERSARKSGFAPIISIKQGQSLEEALAPYQKPNLKFFATTKIPQYLARPQEKGAFGATQLTPQGPIAAEIIVPKPREGS